MPTPQADETRDEFLSSCMGDQMQTKAYLAKIEIKAGPDEDGQIQGMASVFDVVDDGMDVVSPGAFRKTLDTIRNTGRKVPILWQHDPNQPIGVWDEITETERGLMAKGRIFKDVAKGAEAIVLARNGAVTGLSIGYRTKQATQEAGGRVRRLMELELFEISLATFPMLKDARITSVKADKPQTERQFEAVLRDAGFSRAEAKAITAGGFKAALTQRDAAEGDAADAGGVDAAFVQTVNQFFGGRNG